VKNDTDREKRKYSDRITTLLNTKPTCSERPATNHMYYGTAHCRLMIDIHAVHIILEDMSDGPSFFYIK